MSELASSSSKKRSASEDAAAGDDAGGAATRARKGASRANILVTGTPGVGKSFVAEVLAARLGMKHVSVSDLAKSSNGLGEWDAERDCHVLDEDAVLDAMEPALGSGGCVVEYHACDFFPERWFDLVLVLRARTDVLYDRLKTRGYAEAKLQENLQCEIMQVCLEEARESYAQEIVIELPNNAVEDRDAGVARVEDWHRAWCENNAK